MARTIIGHRKDLVSGLVRVALGKLLEYVAFGVSQEMVRIAKDVWVIRDANGGIASSGKAGTPGNAVAKPSSDRPISPGSTSSLKDGYESALAKPSADKPVSPESSTSKSGSSGAVTAATDNKSTGGKPAADKPVSPISSTTGGSFFDFMKSLYALLVGPKNARICFLLIPDTRRSVTRSITTLFQLFDLP